jgi:hypothetical protein
MKTKFKIGDEVMIDIKNHPNATSNYIKNRVINQVFIIAAIKGMKKTLKDITGAINIGVNSEMRKEAVMILRETKTPNGYLWIRERDMPYIHYYNPLKRAKSLIPKENKMNKFIDILKEALTFYIRFFAGFIIGAITALVLIGASIASFIHGGTIVGLLVTILIIIPISATMALMARDLIAED